MRDIKEKLCYVAEDYEKEDQAAQSSSEHDKSYTMPDKRVITVPAHVRMSCPERLFSSYVPGSLCSCCSYDKKSIQ